MGMGTGFRHFEEIMNKYELSVGTWRLEFQALGMSDALEHSLNSLQMVCESEGLDQCEQELIFKIKPIAMKIGINKVDKVNP